jgi:hypothetical protein
MLCAQIGAQSLAKRALTNPQNAKVVLGRTGEAEIQLTVEFEDMPGMKVRIWGADEQRVGPKRNPEHDRRDYLIAQAFRSARAVGWSYKGSIAFASATVNDLRQNCSDGTIAAALANPRLPKEMRLLGAAEVEARAQQYGLRTTISRIKS